MKEKQISLGGIIARISDVTIYLVVLFYLVASIVKQQTLDELNTSFDWHWWLLLMVSRIFSITVKRFYDDESRRSERGED